MKVVKKHARCRVNTNRLKAQAVEVAAVGSFPELAALLIARRFGALDRKADARRVLLRYLSRHRETPAILAALKTTA